MHAFFAFLAFFFLIVTAQRASAQANSSITGSSVIVDRGTGNETYDGQSNTSATDFQGANLGTFDITNFNAALLLNGGTVNTTEAFPDVINAGRLTYRIRANGSTTNLSTGTIEFVQGTPNGGARTFSRNNANINVLTGLTAGTYSLSVQYVVDGVNADSGDDFTKSDPPGAFYRATFTITGTRPTEPPTSTTWTGGKNDNWFDAANWTNGVPTKEKDATIPDFGSGSTVQYPNIYSNAVKPNSTTTTRVQNQDGTFSEVITQVPGYNNANPASGPAQTRDLIMQGSNQAERSITRLVVGRLEVFRNFSNLQDSFIQRENTTIAFSGVDQTISGSASGLVNVEIDGGGIKTLERNFAVQSGGVLTFISGILSTNITDVNTSFVELSAATVSAGVTIPSGRIAGETSTSYLRGFVKTSQVAASGVAQDFGNIGLSLTFGSNNPGIVTVTRNTAINYAVINNGNNAKPSIRRIFGVRPADQQTNNGGLTATMVFSYADGETKNLNPGNQTLDESKLALFVSTSSGDVFGQLGRDALNTETNQLTKFNVRTFATFTLSEATEPLPVTLTAFSAKRVNQDAVLAWETVMELNNKGFDVQVSTDGRTFRTLAFIPSQSSNSNRLLSYRYDDKEAGKSGIRYYRLRQIDIDGKEKFTTPRAVSFAGNSPENAAASVFPNPFTDLATLSVSSGGTGIGRVNILDMTGRVIRQQDVQLSAGTTSITLDNLAGLERGIYLVRFTAPDGKTETMRIAKN